MTGTVFFHIGLHKTATTWLQCHLFPNIEGLRYIHTTRFEHVVIGTEPLLFSSEEFGGTLSRKRIAGDSRRRLEGTLARIAVWSPDAAIVVGFREHESWLNSVYAQRAKKRSLSWRRFVSTFSREELSWCQILDLIERSHHAVFPFLYEELIYDPAALVDDLCGFIGVAPPSNVDALVAIRENPSARSLPGQLVSRLFFRTALTKRFRNYGKRLGASVDRYFAPRKFTLEPEVAAELHKDWVRLLGRVDARRGRDFTAFFALQREQKVGGSESQVPSSVGNRPVVT